MVIGKRQILAGAGETMCLGRSMEAEVWAGLALFPVVRQLGKPDIRPGMHIGISPGKK